MGADQPVGGIGEAEAQLLGQMIAQRARALREVIDPPPLGVEGVAAAAADAGIEGAIQPAAVSHAPGVIGIGEIAVERRVRGTRDRFGRDEGEAVAAGDRCHRLVGRRGFSHRQFRPLVALEQRVAVKFLLHEAGEFEVRVVQQFDGLPQLRGHHQGLRLAHDQPWPDFCSD